MSKFSTDHSQESFPYAKALKRERSPFQDQLQSKPSTRLKRTRRAGSVQVAHKTLKKKKHFKESVFVLECWIINTLEGWIINNKTSPWSRACCFFPLLKCFQCGWVRETPKSQTRALGALSRVSSCPGPPPSSPSLGLGWSCLGLVPVSSRTIKESSRLDLSCDTVPGLPRPGAGRAEAVVPITGARLSWEQQRVSTAGKRGRPRSRTAVTPGFLQGSSRPAALGLPREATKATFCKMQQVRGSR